MKPRGEVFRYTGLEVTANSLTGHYELDGRRFQESVTFEGVDDLTAPPVVAVAQLWYLIAGLSYFKTAAPRRIDAGTTPLGVRGRLLLEAAVRDGLAEFAFRNDLPLDDVVIEGGLDATRLDVNLDANRVLTPFGGGIDSVVTTTQLNPELEQALFIVSPASGRFAPLEATASLNGSKVVRATRELDPQVLSPDESFFNGHVPVTLIITLLAATAAVASGRGGVVMSNEHSASVPNLRWRSMDVNHQWSKSWDAEVLLGEALAERLGHSLSVASFLRDRSELWVAQVFSSLTSFHHVFRSCNRAFAQSSERRAVQWCGQCDKCLFINLVLAPFLARTSLASIFKSEPLSDVARVDQLRSLVGLGTVHKPFECVGDPDESAAALLRVAGLDEWSDVGFLQLLAHEVSPRRSFEQLLQREGPSRVPAHWLR